MMQIFLLIILECACAPLTPAYRHPFVCIFVCDILLVFCLFVHHWSIVLHFTTSI